MNKEVVAAKAMGANLFQNTPRKKRPGGRF
jgi:hypothetical protein